MKYSFYGRMILFTLLSMFLFANVSYAKTEKEIDASVDEALARFEKEVYSGKEMLKEAKGVLVFPKVMKGGIVIGGEYGVGALRIKGKTVDYYNMAGGSIGFQLGGQVMSVYLLFMDVTALEKFRIDKKWEGGWQAGVGSSVTLIKVGADGSVDTTKTNEPILGFVLGQKGLMYSLSFEGVKYNKIKPE